MAVTSNGVVVMGHYLDLAARHSVRLPEPSLLFVALSGGPRVDLAAAPELTQADDVANLVSFGQGVVVLHTRKVRTVLPALGQLAHYALSRPGGDTGTAVGAPVRCCPPSDEGCTVVSQLVPVTGGADRHRRSLGPQRAAARAAWPRAEGPTVTAAVTPPV